MEDAHHADQRAAKIDRQRSGPDGIRPFRDEPLIGIAVLGNAQKMHDAFENAFG
jgi:hypothetical protein